MKFPDHSDLGTITVEDVGEFRVTMDRIGTVASLETSAEIKRLRAALRYFVTSEAAADREIARLRKIEEAARQLLDDWWIGPSPMALRAALEADHD